jgi:propanol-preferring alcohol dehydrogenase
MNERHMRAMVLDPQSRQLRLEKLPIPQCTDNQVLVKVEACGVCRTDLHVIDGELASPKPNVIPGHEIVGIVVERGDAVKQPAVGDRVGIPWLGQTCGKCRYCINNQENLCDNPTFTGYTRDGGFAEYTVADSNFCFPLNFAAAMPSYVAAPFLCAGLIGWRSFKFAGHCTSIGLYGFGAAAHILCQILQRRNCDVFAFTRDGDESGQAFAKQLGAVWAGNSSTPAPKLLDATIIFAPVGPLVPLALQAVHKGGVVVCGGIHMSPIPSFSYDILWGERIVRSVANLTRADANEFFGIADLSTITPTTQQYNLEDANHAIADVREGKVNGAAVLIP